jgi:hypothetical protein
MDELVSYVEREVEDSKDYLPELGPCVMPAETETSAESTDQTAEPQETKPTVRTRWRPIEALPAAVKAAEIANENVSDERDQTT